MGKDELGYRPCVGIMLLNSDNHVWVGRRLDRDKNEGRYANGNWWQMPQGGIDTGETPQGAVLRELHEETGIDASRVKVLGVTPKWLHYDLPEELVGKVWGGKFRGQKQRWFALRFRGEDSEFNIGPRKGIKAEFDAWKWVSVDELSDLIIPFKREVYGAVLREFSQLVKAD